MTQTYVYNGKEVYLTGRSATKKRRSGSPRVLYETRQIKYINMNDDNVASDWVELKDLYEITKDEDDNNED